MSCGALIIDVGNTAIKCSDLAQPQTLIWQGPVAEFGQVVTEKALDHLPAYAVSSSPTNMTALRAALPQVQLLGEELALPQRGQYPDCGLDRVIAGLGAQAEDSTAVVVVDAGTATTITVWDDHGQLAGGQIAPSRHACLQGLLAMAPGLAPLMNQVEVSANANPLAMDSASAMRAPLELGYPAMIVAAVQASCRAFAERYGSTINRLVLTGGARKALRHDLAAIGLEMVEQDALVSAGLAAWVRQSQSHIE